MKTTLFVLKSFLQQWKIKELSAVGNKIQLLFEEVRNKLNCCLGNLIIDKK